MLFHLLKVMFILANNFGNKAERRRVINCELSRGDQMSQ